MFQFALRKDLSCDMLADDDDYDEEEEQNHEKEGNGQVGSKDETDAGIECVGESKRDVRSSCSSLDMDRKPSRVVRLFLVADKNFPRTLFVMAIVQAVTWGPFYLLILISPMLTVQLPREAFLLSVWLGYSQSVISPFLIYLVSDWVHEELNKIVALFIKLCTGEPKANNLKLSTYSIEVRQSEKV